KDVSETDQYGRLLRYVWLEDGAMLNELLVLGGYAVSSTYPPDVHYQDRFLAAERQAREAGAGLWGEVCQDDAPAQAFVPSAPSGPSAPAPTATASAPPPPPPVGGGSGGQAAPLGAECPPTHPIKGNHSS